MTKKKLLLGVFIGVTSFFLALFSREISLCPPFSYSTCSELFDGLAMAFFPVLPLFLFSLITYFMREEVFQAWFRFARIYIPAAILLILLAPSYTHNWMFPYDKGMAAFIFSAGFVLISIGVIAVARVRMR